MTEQELEIKLTFHTDDTSARYPTGYWAAQAAPVGGTVDWDGAGATPLDATMDLAKQMHRALARRHRKDQP